MDINTIIAGIGGVITAVVTVAAGFVIHLLKAKQGTEKVKQEAAKFESYVAKAKQVVCAAKQITDLVTNEEMSAYADKQLLAMGVPSGILEVVKEAAVLAAKAENAAYSALDAADKAIMQAIDETRATDVASDETENEDGAQAASDTAQVVTTDNQTADTTAQPAESKTITISNDVYSHLVSLGIIKEAA
jgi:hypothetical protein